MVTADEKLAERPCEETVDVVVRARLCFAVETEVLVANERDEAFPELNVCPTVPPPMRDCGLRRPALASSETESSTEAFFRVLTEVEDIRRDRLRSRVTSRSSDRLPRGVN